MVKLDYFQSICKLITAEEPPHERIEFIQSLSAEQHLSTEPAAGPKARPATDQRYATPAVPKFSDGPGAGAGPAEAVRHAGAVGGGCGQQDGFRPQRDAQ